MARQYLPLNSTLVQGTSDAAADSVVERDNNGDSEARRWVATESIRSEGGLYLGYATKTGNYTATSSDHYLTFTLSAAATLTLPAAASNAGHTLVVKRLDSTSYVLTVDGSAAETIDGDASIYLTLQYESVTLFCDGTNWHVLDRTIPVRTVTKNANWTVVGEGTVYLVTTGASDVTATLPPAAGWKGKPLYFKKVDGGAGDVVLEGDAAETIDGQATFSAVIDSQYEIRCIVSDGSNWHILSASSPG